MSTYPEKGRASGMIDDDDEQAPQADGSVWAAMRATHAAISAERPPLDLPLPGYAHHGIGVRYQYVPITGSGKTAERLQKLKGIDLQAVEGAAVSLAKACVAITGLVASDPPRYAPLPTDDGSPLRFDQRLCANMGLDVPRDGKGKTTAAAIVRLIFGGTQGERALLDHAQEVMEWMASEREQIGDDFVQG